MKSTESWSTPIHDLQELGGASVALVVVEQVAETALLRVVAAADDVEQNPVRKTVATSRPVAPPGWEDQSGTECDQELHVRLGCDAAETERLKFLVAFRPGLVPPTLAAQQAATLQRFSEGRVLLNVVSGGDDAEQRRFGDWLDHDQRYARTAEFLQIVTSVWRQESVDFTGKYYTVADARVLGATESVAGDLLRRFLSGSIAYRG